VPGLSVYKGCNVFDELHQEEVGFISAHPAFDLSLRYYVIFCVAGTLW
jgi:hypothetical protein